MASVHHRLAEGASSERRGALRHAVAMEGLLATSGMQQQVRLTDISERGCRIVRPAGIAGGEAIRLGFGGFAPFDATVVWTSARAAGLRFDYPAHPALIAEVVAAASGRKPARRPLAPELVRREGRERLWHLRLPVSFRVGAAGAPVPALLCDLSSNGCRIVAAVTPLPGVEVEMSVGADLCVPGRVTWSEEGSVGITFAAPLPPTVVAAVAERGC